MDLRGYLRAVRKSWWIVVAVMLLCGSAAYLHSSRSTKIYAAHVDFYVSTRIADGQSPLGADQFAQARATSYAELVSSDRLADSVLRATGLPLTRHALAAELSGAAHLNTVIVTATVHDPSRARALTIAQAVAKQFPVMVDALEGESQSSSGKVSLEVVSGPAAGAAPIAPRTKLTVLLGLGLGLLLGLIFAVVRELLDQSVRTGEELEAATGGRMLATVGFDPTARRHPLLIGDRARSSRAEALRQLRTNVQFVDATQPFEVLAVTSSVAGEGKSTTAANLAMMFAESGEHVLLIDADLRRPRLAALLGVERAVGLSSVLAGRVSFDDALQPWGEQGLEVLASGPIPPNPSELLGSPAMAGLLSQARSRFDRVVIDTPPALPVADAAVLSSQVDGVLLVFRHGRTHRSDVASVARSLQAANTPYVGCVMNMVPAKGLRRGYRYGYGYAHSVEPGDHPVGHRGSSRLARLGGRLGRLVPGTNRRSPRMPAETVTMAAAESLADLGELRVRRRGAGHLVADDRPARQAVNGSSAAPPVVESEDVGPHSAGPRRTTGHG